MLGIYKHPAHLFKAFYMLALHVKTTIVTTLFMSLFFSLSIHAETNASGDEITILSDIEIGAMIEPEIQTTNAVSDFEIQSSISGKSTNHEDLWSRIKNGYAIPEIKSGYTSTHESWYASRPDYVKRMIERSQKYLFHIVEEVEKRGMPTEIALLPMVESAYNPQAYSRSHASGIWQFIPSTGKNYGLQQNWWVDNRRDVMAATEAALNYLQKLHGMFGSWDLALAAYNAGEGTVQRAISRNQSKGLPTDYQNLNLPPETRNYVPKLQAVKNIITNPEKYGLQVAAIPNQAYFVEVTAPEKIDVKLAAQLAEVSLEEFSALNPEYNRPVLTSSGKVHKILLPISSAEIFKANLANYNKPLVNWQTYHAKRGERMDTIANRFGIGVSQLRDINGLPSHKKISSTTAVLVPSNGTQSELNIASANENTQEVEPSNPPTATNKTHQVKKGENLALIAKKYGVSSQQIMRDNKLNSSRVKPGQFITVSLQSKSSNSARVSNATQRHYKKPTVSRSKKFLSKKPNARRRSSHFS